MVALFLVWETTNFGGVTPYFCGLEGNQQIGGGDPPKKDTPVFLPPPNVDRLFNGSYQTNDDLVPDPRRATIVGTPSTLSSWFLKGPLVTYRATEPLGQVNPVFMAGLCDL